MKGNRRSQGVFIIAVALLAVSCGGGPDRPVSGAGEAPDAGAEEAEHREHEPDASGGGSDQPSAEPRTTEQTLATFRSLDPDRLASLHEHDATRDHDPDGARDHPNGVDPERVVISAIGVDADVIDLGLQADGTMEVPTDFDQAGWFAPGPRPGRVGPAVIAGHVDSREGPAVFFRLTEVEVGDEIEIHGDDGEVVTFAVRDVEQHPKDAFPTERVYAGTPGAELRLITCGGVFDASERSYRDNIIVFADRIDHPGHP